jgi:hypothetical protein
LRQLIPGAADHFFWSTETRLVDLAGARSDTWASAVEESGAGNHLAINTPVGKTGIARVWAIGRRTTRHPGYDVSQRCRKRIEESALPVARLTPPATASP